jgi:hypothetical protein
MKVGTFTKLLQSSALNIKILIKQSIDLEKV